MQSKKDVTTSNSRSAVPVQNSKKVTKMPGATSKNLGVTSKFAAHLRGNTKTKGKFSTTNTQPTNWEREIVEENGKNVDLTPLPLIPITTEEEKKKKEEAEQSSKASQFLEIKDPSEARVTASRSEMTSSLLKSTDQSEVYSEVSDDTAREEAKHTEEAKEEDDGRITEADLSKWVDVELAETETMTLLFIPSRAVSTKDEFKEEVDKMNDKYQHLLKEKVASDSFGNKAAQTINLMQKHKEIATDSFKKKDFEGEVTHWMLHDAYLEDPPPSHVMLAREFETEVGKSITENIKMPGTLLNAESFITQTINSNSISATQQNVTEKPTGTSSKVKTSTAKRTENSSKKVEQSSRSIMSSSSINASKQSHTSSGMPDETTPFKANEDIDLPESLISKFNIIERILTQNKYLEQQISYRNYPKIEFEKRQEEEKKEEQGIANRFLMLQMMSDKKATQEVEEDEESEEETSEPHLADLFQYSCPQVENRTVTCADWNTLNPDLLAVSYGEYDHVSNKEGLLMFWTLKSPKFPERIIRAPTGITSCMFSSRNPNLIATGSYDGVVAIYDVRKKDNKPVAESSQMLEKHIDTVWEVRWHDQGAEKGENLVSISSDGRIVEWSIKKGLEFRDLINLKKPTNPNQKDDKEGTVFRTAVGFTLDFPKDQNLLYLAGTEEGTIHKCSLSYNDELDVYWGHNGPVYKIRCNPYWPHIMMSCSADWTVQLWDWRRDEVPVMSCHCTDLQDAVNDIEWSPHDSCVFGSVADDGRVEIWDLSYSNIKPLITKKPESRSYSRTMIRFCNEYPVLVSGNTQGIVDVYRLKNMEKQPMTNEEQRQRLEKAIYPGGRNKDLMSDREEDEEEGDHQQQEDPE